MRALHLCAAGVLAVAASASSAQTTQELINDGKNTDNVLTYGMGYGQNATARSRRSTRAT